MRRQRPLGQLPTPQCAESIPWGSRPPRPPHLQGSTAEGKPCSIILSACPRSKPPPCCADASSTPSCPNRLSRRNGPFAGASCMAATTGGTGHGRYLKHPRQTGRAEDYRGGSQQQLAMSRPAAQGSAVEQPTARAAAACGQEGSPPELTPPPVPWAPPAPLLPSRPPNSARVPCNPLSSSSREACRRGVGCVRVWWGGRAGGRGERLQCCWLACGTGDRAGPPTLMPVQQCSARASEGAVQAPLKGTLDPSTHRNKCRWAPAPTSSWSTSSGLAPQGSRAGRSSASAAQASHANDGGCASCNWRCCRSCCCLPRCCRAAPKKPACRGAQVEGGSDAAVGVK